MGATDFLAGQARYVEAEHVTFSLGKQCVAITGFPVGVVAFAGAYVLAHRVLQRLQKHLVVHRLFEEFCGTGLECTAAHFDRALMTN